MGCAGSGRQRRGSGSICNSRCSDGARLEQKDEVTGRTGEALRMENAGRGKEGTDGAEGGGDTCRSKVSEKTGSDGVQDKDGRVASESGRGLSSTEGGRRPGVCAGMAVGRGGQEELSLPTDA